ncbi:MULTISPECIES: MFS transporter [Kitasatospora]|uniref:Putative major facilitator superfamily transporter n=1 Tax=Kitasatospora setae (strain ATCC 33774 / DSM 43861 / JCM 3304 / KCC A-0304 / NBRC 14216 / KM-6054) TaxID=452652 RepID=E4N1F2_KITSK|nr:MULTISPECIES: MFS transporter [Kitasatospora]BAJ31986.1 putative major facilitator superfamily transporter [Kitasatospora setae KM-6054]
MPATSVLGPPPVAPSRAARRHRRSLQLCFAIPGLALATWVTRTPDVRDGLGASTAGMGLVLSGMAVGSMLGILVAGALVARFATRPVVATGMLLVLASVTVTGLGTATASAPLVTAGLFLIGAGMGLSEVASNVDGALVEREYGRPVLPALHGCYSLGTVLGAVLGVAGAAAGLPVPWHLAAVLLLVTGLFAAALPGLRPGLGRPGPDPDGPRTDGGRERRLYLDPRLLMIGGVVFATTLAEGAATDWLPLLMVDGHDMPAGLGSSVYAGFAATMALGRFAGGPVVARLGRPAVLGGGALLTAAGIALVSLVDSPAAAGSAVLLWGLGTALGFPLALSAAGDSGPDTTGRIALTSRIGYAALLSGPPLLGLLGEHLGLRAAMLPVLLLALAAAALSPATGTRRGRR